MSRIESRLSNRRRFLGIIALGILVLAAATAAVSLINHRTPDGTTSGYPTF